MKHCLNPRRERINYATFEDEQETQQPHIQQGHSDTEEKPASFSDAWRLSALKDPWVTVELPEILYVKLMGLVNRGEI